MRTDRNNFAPRLGVAYRPFGDGETVIRAGYGLYYDMMPIDLQAARAPFVFTETPFTNPAAPTVVLPAVFPAAGTAGPAAIALPLAVNPDLQMPYSHQWNVTVEHERWHTGFRAVVRRHARPRACGTRATSTRPQADGRLYIEKPRPFPQYPEHHLRRQRREPRLPRRHARSRTPVSRRACSSRWPTPRAKDTTETVEWSNAIENPFDLERERGRDSATPLHRLTTARDVRPAVRPRDARG